MANQQLDGSNVIVIGIDTGGTFTDLIVQWTPENAAHPRTVAHKLLSTPHNPAEAVMQGLQTLLTQCELHCTSGDIAVVHGSTVATNALLERQGAHCAFVTTAGFEDLLTIGRQTRRSLYDLRPQVPDPLIPASRCYGVNERVTATGKVLQPLSDTELTQLVEAVAASGVDSVALCLLFSFVSPEHEKRIAEAFRRAGLFVSASHHILPEHREYERAATTAINAYVSPLMQRYLEHLTTALQAKGIHRLHVMQSSGGSMTADQAGSQGVQTVLSGPAGGVVGAFTASRRVGRDHIVSFDMGGTSTDVTLLPGRLQTTTEGEIDGLPVRVPILAIQTVGAGGGSIAFRDKGGALRVGPRSAGASPGPACYGLGGTEPTVTDAHVVLGRLPVASFLGGRMQLDMTAAHAAIGRLAQQLDASVAKTAWGIVQVANVQMERAMRVISVEKGYDPRDFTLVSFGGAGGLHASDLARTLGMREVLIPPHPGLLSAWGMSVADIVKTSSQGIIGLLQNVLPDGLRALHHLMAAATHDLRDEARIDGRVYIQPTFDLRYLGQSFEIAVDLPLLTWDVQSPAQPAQPRVDFDNICDQFHQQHLLQYAYRTDEPIECVAVRVRAWCHGTMPETEHIPITRPPATARAPASTTSRAFIDGVWHEVPIVERNCLPRDFSCMGPAVITEDHATVVAGKNDRVWIDAVGNLRIEIN